jgi:hypothetical protein
MEVIECVGVPLKEWDVIPESPVHITPFTTPAINNN